MLTLTYDEGWDEEIVGVSSKGYKALKTNLVDDGLVAHYKGNTYVYLSSMNKWGVMISAEAQRQICDITGGENATVSYLGASLPYIPFMEKHALRTSAIPPSICIGTRRLAISESEDKNTITLTECIGIASAAKNLDQRVQQFCFMPCSFNQFPQTWSANQPGKLTRFLRVLFTDKTEFETILWIIGMAAVDPGSSSKFLLLVGEGGTGKSTLISAIEDIFSGCSGTMASSVLTTKNYNIITEVARTIASNRVVTAGDLNLENAQMNLHTVKEITGHDSVSIPPIKVRTRCTLIAASNDLPHPSKQKEWCTPAISRRTVVVPMTVKTSLIPDVEKPDTIADCIDTLMLGVSTFLQNKNFMPISYRSLMLTVLGSGFLEIEQKLVYDIDADQQDIFDANTGIEIYFGIQLHTLGELAMLVSRDSVVQFSDIYFINNIRMLEQIVKED